MKIKDWYLADHENFPHLGTKQLMHCIIDTKTGMNTLLPWKWLRGVEKKTLLNLLLVSHYNCTLVTVLVIRWLLYLVHDGFLWLKETIPIIYMLIHCKTSLLYTGKNLVMIFGGKDGELELAESMKEKLKLVKKSCR